MEAHFNERIKARHKAKKGIEYFYDYVEKRDHSGSNIDNYGQFLETLYMSIREKLFPLLFDAEKAGKMLSLVSVDDESLRDEITEDDVIAIPKSFT